MKLLKNHYLLLVALLISLPAELVAGAQPASCDRVEPTVSPDWTVAGSWDPSGRVMYLMDQRNRKALRYVPGVGSQGPFSPFNAAYSGAGPLDLRPRGDGFAVQLADERFLFLDSALRKRAVHDPVANTEGLEALFSFQRELVGSSLVVCADVRVPVDDEGTSEWRSGFYELPLVGTGRLTPLLAFSSTRAPARLFCRLGFPQIASVAGVPYLLVMEQEPTLYRWREGSLESIPGMPAVFSTRPALRTNYSRSEYAALMKEIEDSTMPVSLHSWNGSLWLLGREALGGGETLWTLTRIDPAAGGDAQTFVVPSSANHILAIPGPRMWGFVEKGGVRSLGDQDVESLLYVPARAMKAAEPGQALCELSP